MIACTLFKKENIKISTLKKIINSFTNFFINPYMYSIWNVYKKQRNDIIIYKMSDNITKLNKNTRK